MVFRVEGEFTGVAADGGEDGASDEWAGDFAVEIVRGSRVEIAIAFGKFVCGF